NYKINNDIIFGKDIEKLLLITQIIIFPILLFYVVKYQRLLDELGHTYARLIKYDLGLLFSSVFESALYSYILQPLLTIISILVAIKFVQGKIRNITFILMFINLILNTQIGLGRFGYFQLLVYIFTIYFLYKNKITYKQPVSRNNKKQKVVLIFISIILITIMNYTLLLRRGLSKVGIKDLM